MPDVDLFEHGIQQVKLNEILYAASDFPDCGTSFFRKGSDDAPIRTLIAKNYPDLG